MLEGDRTRPVARLSGDIDLTNVSELAEALARSVENTALGLVVDLSQVTYLDSTGLRLLFRLSTSLQSRQQDLHLVVPHASPLRRVLVLAGVEETAPLLCAYAPGTPVTCPHV